MQLTKVLAAVLVTVLLAGCGLAGNNEDVVEIIGSVIDGIDVPESVLAAAKATVQDYFDQATQAYPDYEYVKWRIEALEDDYTYEDLDGRRLALYRLNYEFLSEAPENILPAGGMYLTDDNWVMPTYPNSTYLIFQEEDDSLAFLEAVMINDSSPGEELFTDDLRRVLSESD